MTDQERLAQIIETAMKHGWKFDFGKRTKVQSWSVGEDMLICVTYELPPTRAIHYGYISVPDAIYGDNLSLLKAACGEESRKVSKFYAYPHEWTTPVTEELTIIPSYQWVAQESIVLPDSERLRFICDHLREDNGED